VTLDVLPPCNGTNIRGELTIEDHGDGCIGISTSLPLPDDVDVRNLEAMTEKLGNMLSIATARIRDGKYLDVASRYSGAYEKLGFGEHMVGWLRDLELVKSCFKDGTR